MKILFLHAALHACVCRYSRESYLELVDNIHSIIPGVNIDVRIHMVSRSSIYTQKVMYIRTCIQLQKEASSNVIWCCFVYLKTKFVYCHTHTYVYTHADVALSSDFIAGFCGETEEEHCDTISLLDTVKFDMAYMFAYSMRKVGSN